MWAHTPVPDEHAIPTLLGNSEWKALQRPALVYVHWLRYFNSMEKYGPCNCGGRRLPASPCNICEEDFALLKTLPHYFVRKMQGKVAHRFYAQFPIT